MLLKPVNVPIQAMVVLLMHYLDFALVVTGKDTMHIMSSLLAFSIAIPEQDLQLG